MSLSILQSTTLSEATEVSALQCLRSSLDMLWVKSGIQNKAQSEKLSPGSDPACVGSKPDQAGMDKLQDSERNDSLSLTERAFLEHCAVWESLQAQTVTAALN